MILIAGGSGRLGRALLSQLDGASVRVLSRSPARAEERLGGRAEIIAGDVREPGTLGPAMGGVDTVVSAVTGFGPGADGVKAVDEDGNRNLIAAAVAAGVRRFLLLSVEQASPEHPMQLMRRKYAAEQSLRQSGLQWTIVRPTAFAELWAGIVGDPIARGATTVVFGKGDNPVNFVSATDVAAVVGALLADADWAGETISVGGPADVTMNELVRLVETATGRNAHVRHLPHPLLRVGRVLTLPFRPDISGLLEAAACMASTNMGFDAAPVQERFPRLTLTPVEEVVQSRFGAGPGRGASLPDGM